MNFILVAGTFFFLLANITSAAQRITLGGAGYSLRGGQVVETGRLQGDVTLETTNQVKELFVQFGQLLAIQETGHVWKYVGTPLWQSLRFKARSLASTEIGLIGLNQEGEIWLANASHDTFGFTGLSGVRQINSLTVNGRKDALLSFTDGGEKVFSFFDIRTADVNVGLDDQPVLVQPLKCLYAADMSTYEIDKLSFVKNTFRSVDVPESYSIDFSYRYRTFRGSWSDTLVIPLGLLRQYFLLTTDNVKITNESLLRFFSDIVIPNSSIEIKSCSF